MKKHTILIIDDQPGIRSLIVKILGSQNYYMIEAGSPIEGHLRLIEHPDLILLDISMGSDNSAGLKFLGKIRESGNDTPVIIISSYVDDGFMGEIPYTNVTGISKPFDSKRLIEVVKNSLPQTT